MSDFERQRRIRTTILALATSLLPIAVAAQAHDPHAEYCRRAAGTRVYSSAHYVKEAGDVVGYDLALSPDGRTALLYDYQGTPFSEPIPLQGNRTNGKVSYQGELTQTVIQYPEKKRVPQVTRAKVEGALQGRKLKARVMIDGYWENVEMHLRPAIWACVRKK